MSEPWMTRGWAIKQASRLEADARRLRELSKSLPKEIGGTASSASGGRSSVRSAPVPASDYPACTCDERGTCSHPNCRGRGTGAAPTVTGRTLDFTAPRVTTQGDLRRDTIRPVHLPPRKPVTMETADRLDASGMHGIAEIARRVAVDRPRRRWWHRIPGLAHGVAVPSVPAVVLREER